MEKYSTLSFVSIVGAFAYAYPSTEEHAVSLKKILSCKEYIMNVFNSKEEAQKAMDRMKDIIANAK